MMADGGMGGDGGDDAPPTTAFVSTPLPGQTDGVPSTFTLGCDEAVCTFECSLDGAAFAPCDATVAFDDMTPGTHTLAVRATDAAGNVEATPSEHTFTLGAGYRAVAANASAACAISGQGGLYCWGDDGEGLLGDGPSDESPVAAPTRVGTASDWEALFDGPETICGRRAGALYCWGGFYALGDEQASDPVLEPTLLSNLLVSLDVSYNAACGLDQGGGLYCVGEGEDGLLGDGNTADGHYVTTPTRVGTETYSQVSVGEEHACAIRADGRLLCWGRQPVVDTLLSVPTLGNDPRAWRRVSVGEQHACAIDGSGALFCWGENYDGQLGLGDFDGVVEPTRVGSDSDWVEVSAWESGTCALKDDGRAFCWGDNRYGTLGALSAPLDRVNAPTPVSTTVGLRTLAGTSETQCAQSVLGEVRCWGRNDYGLLGRGVLPEQDTMLLIDDRFDRIAITPYGGCGLASGSLLCWGTTRPNGDPAGLPRATPTPVTGDTDWTHVAVSTNYAGHACGIRAGALFCWGSNGAGQLGTGDTAASFVPVSVAAVPGVTGWKHVSVGTQATCAVATNGDLYCWGDNGYGQLGIGTTQRQLLPTQVALTDWDTVEMSDYRVGARRTDGSFYYWGVNAAPSPTVVPGTDWVLVDNTGFGECGIKTDGTLHCTFQGIVPAFQAGSATNWVSIVGPGYPYCALDSQGAVGCFVNNGGNNGFNASPAIESSTGWSQLEALGQTMCGLRNGRERHCRGYRNLGSLGDGFDERVPTPVLAP